MQNKNKKIHLFERILNKKMDHREKNFGFFDEKIWKIKRPQRPKNKN